MRKHTFLLLASLFLVTLLGCMGTLEVGIERTPTPDHAPAATLAALMEENSRLATRAAMLVTPVPTPPDLGRLAYIQGGDIWIRNLLDDPIYPRRLTTDGRNREPRWSPSGEWLTFRKDKQVTVVLAEPPYGISLSPTVAYLSSVPVVQRQAWLIQANGGGARALEQGASVEALAWSPKGDRLAYTALGGGLTVVNADGTNLVTLVPETFSDSGGQGRVGRIGWHPDGTWIAYEWWIQPINQPPTYQGLWMVSVAGKERVELYNSGVPDKGEAILAGWSSFGKSVLFWQNKTPTASLVDGGQLYTVSADPSRPSVTPARVTSKVMLTYADFVVPAPPSAIWKDREVMALVTGGGRSTWKDKHIESVGQSITPDGIAAISPTWSPDGTRLAFAAMTEQADLTSEELEALMQRRIWVTNAFGYPRSRRLTDAGYRDERPLWSADGNYILFVRMDAKGQTSLWIMLSDTGSTPHQVVGELTPAPDPLDFYGHVDWDALFDWWRGSQAPARLAPAP